MFLEIILTIKWFNSREPYTKWKNYLCFPSYHIRGNMRHKANIKHVADNEKITIRTIRALRRILFVQAFMKIVLQVFLFSSESLWETHCVFVLWTLWWFMLDMKFSVFVPSHLSWVSKVNSLFMSFFNENSFILKFLIFKTFIKFYYPASNNFRT